MKQALNENITRLRKQKGMTQEELAAVLGISEQAVSKWESGVCCPDIGLLPALADTFAVTLDELMGRMPPAVAEDDPVAYVCRHLSTLSREGAAEFACRAACALHAGLFAGYMNMPDTKDAIRHAQVGEWGLSAISEPGITTRMYRDAVFFSGNGEHGATWLSREQIGQLTDFLRTLTKDSNLYVLHALYRLTAHSGNDGTTGVVSAEEVGKACHLRAEQVTDILDGDLSRLVVRYDTDKGRAWRIHSECLDVIPILSLPVHERS